MALIRQLLVKQLEKNVLITDLDILPVKDSYFIEPIKDIPDDHFISYTNRYIKQKMLAVCYNLAKGSTWSEIFNIKTKKDIVEKLNKWYNIEYNGIKNCPGWYTDQKKLYQKIFGWSYFESRVKILKLFPNFLIFSITFGGIVIISHFNFFACKKL